jgi:hypothetical protein
LLPALAGALSAQYGTATKASPQDYPARAKLEKLSIGAEYLVHSFSSGRQMFIAKDYLVVEVALFPANGQILLVNTGDFSLRVNGRKQALLPQGAEIVANSRRSNVSRAIRMRRLGVCPLCPRTTPAGRTKSLP